MPFKRDTLDVDPCEVVISKTPTGIEYELSGTSGIFYFLGETIFKMPEKALNLNVNICDLFMSHIHNVTKKGEMTVHFEGNFVMYVS